LCRTSTHEFVSFKFVPPALPVPNQFPCADGRRKNQQQQQQQQQNKRLVIMNNQAADNNGSFPPPLKEELASDKDPPRAGAETFQDLFPRHLEPGPLSITTVGVGLVQHHYRGPPPPIDKLMNSEEDNKYQMERRDIGYLSYILSAWQRRVLEVSNDNPSYSFPTIHDVMTRDDSSAKTYIYYRHAGTRWRSSYFIKYSGDEIKLIVHLANDGYLYMPPTLLGEFAAVTNERHMQSTPTGWLVFKNKSEKHPGGKRQEFYAALNDFRVFANAWFGTVDIRQSLLYNVDHRRIDICFQSKDVTTTIGLEFSFERDWPYPGDDPSWWD